MGDPTLPRHGSIDRRRNLGLGLAVLAMTVLLGLVVWALVAALWSTTGNDDNGAAPTPLSSDDAVTGGIIETDAEPRATPAPLDPERASAAVEVRSVEQIFDGAATTVIVLAENVDTIAYADIAGVVDLVDSGGTTVGTFDLVIGMLDSGAIVPIVGHLDGDVAAIDRARLRYGARGTLAAGDSTVNFESVDWEVDQAGTVTVRGMATASAPLRSVGIVAVLRAADGSAVGFAADFLSSVDSVGTPFAAIGFPTGEVTAVDLYGAL